MVYKISIIAALLLALSIPSIAEEPATKNEVLSYDLKELLELLGGALEVHDELPSLEKSKFIGRDAKDAQSDIQQLIDEAIGILDSESLTQLKASYWELERRIEEQQNLIVEYRSLRLLAPTEDASLVSSVTPTATLKRMVASTRGDYDKLIEIAQNNKTGYEESLAEVTEQLRRGLHAIGVHLNAEQIQTLMSSVVGDDIVSMSVVFRAIKDVTDQLEALTNETSESLEHAKKYYGMVVILYRIVTAMQDKFITQVNGEYLPKLAQYRDDAKANIQQSKNLMSNRVNVDILKANVHANELTLQVIDLYSKMLRQQRDKVQTARDLASKEALVADNTYRTVSLSSAVVGMIKEGGNTFDTLMRIQMPDVRTFQNENVRTEFQKLTEKMNRS